MDGATRTNNKAVIGLVLGILSILIPGIGGVLSIIGIVVSIIATKEIKRTNENGRGLAVAGLICSIVGILIQVLVLIGFTAFYFYVEPTTIVG
ncbi:MAG: DUF4190 domain-containing protein [Bacillaceae bacterium]